MNDQFLFWLKNTFLQKAVFLSLALLLTYGLVKGLQRFISQHVHENALRYRARKALKFIGFLVFFVLLALIFSQQLGQFSVAFGVIGASIAFALQQVITSIAGWIAIALGGFYKPGDRVLMKGVMGDVIDIGVLRTTLMECGGWVDGDLYNGRIVKVANSAVFEQPVYNYNSDFPFLWDELQMPVRYNSNLQLARELIQASADELLGDYSRRAQKAWKTMVAKYLIEDARVYPPHRQHGSR